MRILIHDFAGHPFQLELSRELANRGHHVTHAYFKEDPGPKGEMDDYRSAFGRVDILPISIERPYSKDNFIRRFVDDLCYLRSAHRALCDLDFDVVFSSNTPTWVQGPLMRLLQKRGAKFVYWCQDFYSVAVESVLKQKFNLIGRVAGFVLRRWDRSQMKSSDHVILITAAFESLMQEWLIPSDKISVVPNWGAIANIPVVDRSNIWAREMRLEEERTRVLYSGTLGLKHNPGLILAIVSALKEATVVVVGSGVGFDALQESASDDLKLLQLQPFNRFPEVLASGDILIAMIEPDAGLFSVPSKILSYLCAERPIVLAAPKNNLAAMIVEEVGAGIVVEPDDTDGFTAAVSELCQNKELARQMGVNGRRYAEEHFEIGRVADRFEGLIETLCSLTKESDG